MALHPELTLKESPHEGASMLTRMDILTGLPHFSGEHFGQIAASFSNWTVLMKSSAEWRRTGL
jgi:hypothetical protein